MEAIKKRWPKMLVQFEDFNTELAFELLDDWRDKQTCFNDDVFLPNIQD
jgi:malic enzyme